MDWRPCKSSEHLWWTVYNGSVLFALYGVRGFVPVCSVGRVS